MIGLGALGAGVAGIIMAAALSPPEKVCAYTALSGKTTAIGTTPANNIARVLLLLMLHIIKYV